MYLAHLTAFTDHDPWLWLRVKDAFQTEEQSLEPGITFISQALLQPLKVL